MNPDSRAAQRRAELLRLLLREQGIEADDGVIPVSRDGTLVGSFAQERMWFWHHVLGSRSFIHNVPLTARVRGTLDVAALQAALTALVARQESLRTSFSLAGRVVAQHIHERADVPIIQHDLTGAPDPWAVVDQVRRADARQPFDLRRVPMLRAHLLRLADDDHVFLFTTHHINWDGTSTGLVLHELAAHYQAAVAGQPAALPSLPVQYLDWAAWQRRHLTGETLQRHLDYWRGHLAAAPAVRLPTAVPAGAFTLDDGKTLAFSLTAELTATLAAVAREEDATLFMVLYAAYTALMHRLTGEDDLTIGAYAANRAFPAIEPLIGYFVTCMPIRSTFPRDMTFRQHLRRVSRATLGAYKHQALPIGRILRHVAPTRERGLDEPLYPMDFQFQNVPRPRSELGALSIEILDRDGGGADIDLGIVLWQRLPDLTETDGLQGWFKFRTSLYGEPVIRRLLDRYVRTLEAIARSPSVRLADLPVIAPDEQAAAIMRGPREPAPPGSLPGAIRRFAQRRGDSVALRDGRGSSLSYRALERAASMLAGQLAALDVGQEALVAVISQGSPTALAAVWAAMWRGAAFLLLDAAALPAGRIGAALARTRPAAAFVEPGTDVRLPAATLRLALTASAPEETPAPTGMPGEPTRLASGDLAQVSVTFGPDGTPTGMMADHAALMSGVESIVRELGLHAGDVVAHVAAGQTTGQLLLLAPLACGAELLLVPPELARDPQALASLLAAETITIMQIASSLLAPLIDACESGRLWPRALRWLVLTGCAPPADVVRRWQAAFPGARLLSTYIPGDCAGAVTFQEPRPDGFRYADAETIGLPAASMSVYLLDRQLSPVAPGARGELCVGGAMVGRGYLDDPRRTAERFVPDPFSAVPGARMHRTGDYAARFPGGPIELRRPAGDHADIDGHRVDFEEIDAELAREPGVREAAVVVRPDPEARRRLIAYVVPSTEPSAEADRAAVRSWRDIFDVVYGGPPADDPGFDLSGWTSSYDSAPIGAEDMREWVETTVGRLRGFQAQRVLEIGCGTGLLLWRLAPDCMEYAARDLSPLAIERLREAGAKRPVAGVTLRTAEAADFDGVPTGHYDLVIINSVVQYFPSTAYLEQVVRGAVSRVRPGGRVFLGDLRSLPLLRAFHSAVQLARADPDTSASELRDRIDRAIRLEKELVIDPRIFAVLGRLIPRIASVQLLARLGRCRNEMTQFRFDAVLQLDESPPAEPSARSVAWADGRGLSILRRILADERPPCLAVGDIPDSRCAPALAMERGLAEPVSGATARGLHRAAETDSGVLPDEVAELARDQGYTMTPSVALQAPGHFDVLLRRGHGTSLGHETSPAAGELQDYANAPSAAGFAADLADGLRRTLAQRLAPAATPSAFVVLGTLPRLPDGEVNRVALPGATVRRAHPGRLLVRPRTTTERKVAEIWSDVLGISPIGVDDRLVEDLGGHSLLAVRLADSLRWRLGVVVSLPDLLREPTVAAVARRMDATATPGTRGPAHETRPLPAVAPERAT